MDGHVYFIRLGNKEQTEFAAWCIDNNKVGIGYDKEAPTSDYIAMCKVAKSFIDKDPESETSKNDWNSEWKNHSLSSKLSKNGKTALRRFAMARATIDYFCTFYNGLFYWGTPKGDVQGKCVKDDKMPETEGKMVAYRILEESEEKKEGEPEFRIRDIEWHNSVNGNDIREGEVSGIISKVRMMQATLSKFSEEGKYAQRTIFEKTINGETLDVVKELIEELEKVKPDQDIVWNHMYDMIQNLSPSSFEAFVDIVFSLYGCNRCSCLGGNQIAYDMEYFYPGQDSTFFVQVKSEIKADKCDEVMKDLNLRLPEGSTCYIVHHNVNRELKYGYYKASNVEFYTYGIEAIMSKVYRNPVLLIFLLNEIAGWRYTKKNFHVIASWKE